MSKSTERHLANKPAKAQPDAPDGNQSFSAGMVYRTIEIVAAFCHGFHPRYILQTKTSLRQLSFV
jgi:hypothetical protein